MGSVEKLRRRNQDFYLLEMMKRVGVQNYSLLARLTGLNAETIRYKVNKHLTRLGLTTTINVNYGELGLSMGYIEVKPNGASGKSWLDRMSYLVFVAKSIGSNRYLCLSAVPFRLKKKYMDALEQIKQEGLIEGYEYRELYWVRYPPFRPEFYDFEERRWKMDWNRFDMTMGEIGASFLSVNRDSVVDLVDLKILSALLKDPTTPLAKTAKEMGVNPRTVRYHHSEHVEKNKFILSHNIRWVRPLQDGNPSGVMQALIIAQKLDEDGMSKVRKFFNSLPFTWLEAGTEERDYLAVIDIPLFEFQTCMQQIEMHLMQVGRTYEVMMLDASKTKPLSIPDEMFEEKRGWRLYSEIEIGRREIKEEGRLPQ
ncbi:MAG: winged helix-turn-helix transcriptional regulator [Nitrososphaerales archaeon]|jgi:DNA-binding Lrp family transcriptional regulator